jgi:hypothetical protein
MKNKISYKYCVNYKLDINFENLKKNAKYAFKRLQNTFLITLCYKNIAVY